MSVVVLRHCSPTLLVVGWVMSTVILEIVCGLCSGT